MDISRNTITRNKLFLLATIASIIAFRDPFQKLFYLSFNNELYSHIFIIPLVSGYLIYSGKKELFSNARYSLVPGIFPIIISALLILVIKAQVFEFNENDYLSVTVLSFLLAWIGLFVVFFGAETFKKVSFPLLFLVFMIPLPTFAVDKIIYLLQSASADISYSFIKLTGAPIFRDGFVFQLTGISVEVAKECSGIRSSMALFIISILAGHFFLGNRLNKIALALLIFPIAVIKNGIRISSLSLLASYVDVTYITDSFIHKQGGILFFMLGLMLLGPILFLLRKSEERGYSGTRKERAGQV